MLGTPDEYEHMDGMESWANLVNLPPPPPAPKIFATLQLLFCCYSQVNFCCNNSNYSLRNIQMHSNMEFYFNPTVA